MSKVKRLTPYVGQIHNRARQGFADVPALEKMLKKSGLQDFYSKSKNLTIVDAYAGYGWFSTALYNSLQPKKMFLMDPTQYSRAPLTGLQEQAPKVITQSSFDPFQWRSFYPVYESIPKKYNKPDRSEVSRDFLFVANLCYIRGESLLYQYIMCILHQNWLQRYGRVRMLIWMSATCAEKLTHGQQRIGIAGKQALVAYQDKRILELEGLIAKSEEIVNDPRSKPKMVAMHKNRIINNTAMMEKCEQKKDDALFRMENKRFKSTILRELTCDYRYLIGGDFRLNKREKTLNATMNNATRVKQIRKRMAGEPPKPTVVHCPYDKEAVVYYKEGYQDMFVPKKHTSLGGLVLVEFTPKNIKLDRHEEWWFVITRLFVVTGLPVGKSLETLGPGATEWMTPHLTESILKNRISQLTLDEMSELVEVFWRWPFKPQVLMDTYEERVVSTPDESTFENSMFDAEEDGDGEDMDDDIV
ncbi:Mitochondrial transcription factor 1 [Yarrowia sp. C11]|nr:Mitochondrial transcription factor 1 [Yarrowia sp. E02]KAG5371685.1 Mitochondrial transcription factor 1 [Yarrowia sp. C11]